ncbi:hypothetical protein NC653_015432 [Populus alba x Populus x berolinensis]|uniref:Uncharacterized protein n=1 Tax=Populus alba x Populus x berolinensis TaxID=444605 RepID=A0AAD6QKJ1_9ROSI|nr:hypothetical protein NC653_015432 [Populus alba x Populus x berolinensis]
MSCCNGAKMIMNLASKPDEQPLGCKCYKEVYSYFDNFRKMPCWSFPRSVI